VKEIIERDEIVDKFENVKEIVETMGKFDSFGNVEDIIQTDIKYDAEGNAKEVDQKEELLDAFGDVKGFSETKIEIGPDGRIEEIDRIEENVDQNSGAVTASNDTDIHLVNDQITEIHEKLEKNNSYMVRNKLLRNWKTLANFEMSKRLAKQK